jgi:EAL and modified HD-GYP domain-containing signal transduction protein
MLATLIPLFDKNMIVRSYSIVAQRDDLLRDAIKGSSGRWDSAMSVEGVEVLQSMGLKTLTDDREVFIPVSNVSLYTDIKGQGASKPEKVVLIIDHYVEPTEKYIERVKALKEQGFRFAARNIPLNQVGDYKPIMDMMEYVFLNHHQVDIEKARRLFHTIFPNLKLVAEDVATPEEYEKLVGIGGFDYYEGEFFRIPKKGQDIELAPLKMTYLELIRIVNKPDFDLTTAADVIGKDPALVVELLKIVNRMTVNSGIK